ncbi:FAD-dependent oxidoreductase [Calidifontibacter terrae]
MKRVVVIGHGMVAARFLQDLDRIAREAGHAIEMTVLGDEPHEPYNRLLLSEVIAGRASLGGLTLPAPPAGTRVLRDIAAVRVDRARRVVVDAIGGEYPYDTVVFATGARPRIPLPRGDLRGIRALRTLDDCRDLLASAVPGRRVAVVGGGLLGLELACGLRGRGVEVVVLHRSATLMERQLDDPAAEVVRASLQDNGIDIELDARIAQLQERHGHVSAVRLDDGRTLPVDLVVVSAGVEPNAQLAREAGLPVDHGIVVGADLRSPADAAVAAIGDCAEVEGRWTGLLAPGWDQAARLAAELCGQDPDRRETAVDIVKLKAVGLSVVALGTIDPEHRVVRLSDHAGRRSLAVSVAHGRVTGAVCVGDAAVAAALTTAYERRSAVPDDPAFLLLGALPGAAAEATTPQAMPGSATVCRCNGVTKKTVVEAHLAGARTVEAVARTTRATTGCGGCRDVVCGLLGWMDEVDPPESATAPVTGSHRAVAAE